MGFLPTPPNGIGFRRPCANGYSVSFINDTGCPSAPKQYNKFCFLVADKPAFKAFGHATRTALFIRIYYSNFINTLCKIHPTPNA
ncbi:MAG: hypothetical protein F6K56_29315 [Moorea sp. SIO3G5]|nr:hypothetical protein [Moorena sp. SIO3G5]